MTAVYNETQSMFTLAMLSELGAGLTAEHASAMLYDSIVTELAVSSAALGPWTVTWGPSVQMVTEYVGALPISVNTVFISYCAPKNQIAVVIAGTNPYSWFDWWVEDWAIGTLVPWTQGPEPAGAAAISAGSATGLEIVRALRPVTGLPGAGMSLDEHLVLFMGLVPGPVDVVVTGHSLGGALAPALALALEASRAAWDPGGKATVSAVSFAAPTTGNAAFASLVERALPGRVQRVHNSLDASPMGWTPSLLSRGSSLYAPTIPPNEITSQLLDYRTRQAEQAVQDAKSNGLDGGEYTHVDLTRPALGGAFRSQVSPTNISSYARFNAQAEYQHTEAYFDLLGLVDVRGYSARMRLAHAMQRAPGGDLRLALTLAKAQSSGAYVRPSP